ncbi:MAG: UDP-N-acetylmuramoyl-L-alanyl-D-glutamate--2,6-diaminopimelate ligase [Clostridia bacterium]|nr:UDP-N-acetylmuramoyl-L-alanyl-D-glutamate--2,6-diaminopimelate ligase [Clostridia bacterium]
MKLKQLFENVEYELINGDVKGIDIKDIVYDSRKANEGTVFVCLCGAAADGHDFAEKAYEGGCRVFVVQKRIELPEDTTVLLVSDTRAALALISDNFFGHPSRDVKVVGITGTKGKTTTTFIIKTLLESCGVKAGLIGTTGASWGDRTASTVNTTPESYETQKILRRMADDGVEVCAMEVSSLGVKQHRVDGMKFFCGVFTNISPDHIGGAEHESYEEYCSFKKKFFEMCTTAVGCTDDENTADMISPVTGNKVLYGFGKSADFCGENLSPVREEKYLGVEFDLVRRGENEGRFRVSLPGRFSVQNALAALAVSDLLGVDLKAAGAALEKVSAPGRAQVAYMSKDYGIIIDYAHNGISLKSLVETIKDYNFKRIIALFGSVGDRAQLRREELGRTAAKLCDYSIITTDDPGFEDPEKICGEIAGFLTDENPDAKYEIIIDRREAVLHAMDMLQEGDILLLCGKGHEVAQKVRGEKVHYSEIETVREGLGFTFREETDFEAFDNFVEDHKGEYQQTSAWPRVKQAWKPYFYAGFCGDERVLTALVLERKLPLAGKLWYIPCGAVCDYKDENLQKAFSDFLMTEMKAHGAFCVIADPLIPLRIDGEEQECGVAAHNLFTKIGYELNTDLDSYTYKHPVQTMIPLKDEDGKLIPAETILKGCEKGVRYSVRVGASRGLFARRYTLEDIKKDPQILEDFMSVMGDTSDRNSFVNRDENYIRNLVETLSDYTDISLVYYDKADDKQLEEERLLRREEALKELVNAPEKKVRGLREEIDIIEKNSASYKQRLEETSDYPHNAKIAVAGGLTIRYGGTASCVFGGTLDLVRNNTRSSHFLNYFRIKESVAENMDFHDLGYVLCENPNPPTMENGTLGRMEPRENFKGIRDFKLSFGARYYEFIGEYILVGNRFKYWIYKEFMPKAKKLKMRLVKLLRKAKK